MTAQRNQGQKITPFLWFDGNAEEAAKFYTSIFKNSKIESLSPMSASFNLDGVEFIALNGGPQFKFTEAISFFVRCETQEEIDYFWERLSAGGSEGRCGWPKDKFGISWQIVPPVLGDLLNDEDEAKSQRVMQAMLKMEKLNIKELEQAACSEWRSQKTLYGDLETSKATIRFQAHNPLSVGHVRKLVSARISEARTGSRQKDPRSKKKL